MKRLEKLILALTFIFICSCEGKRTADFRISNMANITVDSLMINCTSCSSESELTYKPLEINEQIDLTIDLANTPKMDGNYYLKVYLGGEERIKSFGYYTNGYPLPVRYELRILDEEIKISEIIP